MRRHSRALGVRVLLVIGCATILATSAIDVPTIGERAQRSMSRDTTRVRFGIVLSEAVRNEAASGSVTITVHSKAWESFEVQVRQEPPAVLSDGVTFQLTIPPFPTPLETGAAGGAADGSSPDAAGDAGDAREDSIHEYRGSTATGGITLELTACPERGECRADFSVDIVGVHDDLVVAVHATFQRPVEPADCNWDSPSPAGPFSKDASVRVMFDE